MAKMKSLKDLVLVMVSKLEKNTHKIHLQLKRKRICPECGSKQFGRKAVGIWECKKCGFKIAGTAYDIKL